MSETTAKSFKVPKIKRQESKDNLRTLELKSRDAQEISNLVSRSYLERNYKSLWELKVLHLVDNKELEDNYRVKKAEMKEEGRHSRDLVDQYAFLMFRDSSMMAKVIKQGLVARQMPFNALGASKFGVYLCRNADVQLRLADGKGLTNCTLVVFKVILGKCKTLAQQSMTEGENIEPTPNYDCHIPQAPAKPSDTLYLQLARSQVYLYEYTDECIPSERPRQCIPYAILSYEKRESGETSGETASGYGKQTTASSSAALKPEQTLSDQATKMKRTGSYGDIEKSFTTSLGQRSMSDSNFDNQQTMETPLQANVVRAEPRPRDPRLARVNPADPRNRPGDQKINPVDPRLNKGSPRFNIDSKTNLSDPRKIPGDPRTQIRPIDPRLNVTSDHLRQNQNDPRLSHVVPQINTSIPPPIFTDPRFNRASTRLSESIQNLPYLNPSDPRIKPAAQQTVQSDPRLYPSDPRINAFSQDSLYHPSFGPPGGRLPQTDLSIKQADQDNQNNFSPIKQPPKGDISLPRDPRLRNKLILHDSNSEPISAIKSNSDSALLDPSASRLRKKLSIDEYKKKVEIIVKEDESNNRPVGNQFDQSDTSEPVFEGVDLFQSHQVASDENLTNENADDLSFRSDLPFDSDIKGEDKQNISLSTESLDDIPYSPGYDEPLEKKVSESAQDDIVTSHYMMLQTLSALSEPDDMSPEEAQGESDSSKHEDVDSALTMAIRKLVEHTSDMEVLTQAIQVLGQTHDMKDILEALKKAMLTSITHDTEENIGKMSAEDIKKTESPISKAVRKTLSEKSDDDEIVKNWNRKTSIETTTATEKAQQPLHTIPDIPLPKIIPTAEALSENKQEPKVEQVVKFFLDKDEEENSKADLDSKQGGFGKLSVKKSPGIGYSPHKSILSGEVDQDERQKASKQLFVSDIDERKHASESERYDPSALDKDERLPQLRNTCLSPVLSLSKSASVEDVDERKHHSRSVSPDVALGDIDERRSHSRSLSPVVSAVMNSGVKADLGERSISPMIPGISKSDSFDIDERISESRSQSPVTSVSAPAIIRTDRNLLTPIMSPDPEADDNLNDALLNKNNNSNTEQNAITNIPIKQENSMDVDLRSSRNDNEFGDVDWRWTAASEMGDVDLRTKPGQMQSNDYDLPPAFEAVNDFWSKREKKEGDDEFRESLSFKSSDHPDSKPYDSYSTSDTKYDSYETSKKNQIPSYSTSGNVYGEYSSSNKTAVANLTVPPISHDRPFQSPMFYPQQQNFISPRQQPIPPPQQLMPPMHQQPIHPMPQQPLPPPQSSMMNINDLLGSVNLDFANLKNILAAVQNPAEKKPEPLPEEPNEDEVTSNLPAFVTGLCTESPKKDTTLTKYTGKPREWVQGRKPFLHKEEFQEKPASGDPNYDPTLAPQLQKPKTEVKSENIDPSRHLFKQEQSHPRETGQVRNEPNILPISSDSQKRQNLNDSSIKGEPAAYYCPEVKKEIRQEDKEKEKGSSKISSPTKPMIFSLGDTIKQIRETSDTSDKVIKDMKNQNEKNTNISVVSNKIDDKKDKSESKKKKKPSPRKQDSDIKTIKGKDGDPNTSLGNMTPYQKAIIESLETSDLRIKHDDSISSEIEKEPPRSSKDNENVKNDLYSDISNKGQEKTFENENKSAWSNSVKEMELNDMSENSDDENFGLVIDLGETPGKKIHEQAKDTEREKAEGTQTSSPLKEELKQQEETDDCLVLEMEAEKPEVVDLTEDDPDAGIDITDDRHTGQHVKTVEEDSDGAPLLKKIKIEKFEDEEKLKRLAEEAKLAEAFDKIEDSELDMDEHTTAVGEVTKKVMGQQPRKKIVINLKSTGKKSKNKTEESSVKGKSSEIKVNKDKPAESEHEISKKPDNRIDTTKFKASESGQIRTVPSLGQRNLSEARSASPVAVLGNDPHRAPSPVITQQIKSDSKLSSQASKPSSYVAERPSSVEKVPPATQPWSDHDNQQQGNPNQFVGQSGGNIPVVPDLSQISSIPPPHYRSPSPVNQMVSGMSAVGPTGFRSVSPVNTFSQGNFMAQAMQNLQNILTSNAVPGITVPMPPAGPMPMGPTGVPSFRPMAAPPNLAVPPPNLNIPPPSLSHPPLSQPMRPLSNLPYPIPADVRLGAGVPFPGPSGLSMSNQSGPPLSSPALIPSVQGNLTIPVIGQTQQAKKEAMIQDVLHRVRQRAAASPLLTSSAPVPQGMPIQTIGQAASTVKPKHNTTDLTPIASANVEVKKEQKAKEDVLDWFSDKFDIKKEPVAHSTPSRSREEPMSEYSEMPDTSSESGRKRMWEYHESDDYIKKFKPTPSGDNNSEYYDNNVTTEQSCDGIRALKQHPIETVNQATDVPVVPEEMKSEPDREHSDLEEGELSEDSSVTNSPLITEHDNRRVVIQNKLGNNIQVLCAANDIQRIETIGVSRSSSPKRIVKAADQSDTIQSAIAPQKSYHRNKAAVDWADMLQKPHKNEPIERLSAFKRLDSNDRRSVSKQKPAASADDKEEVHDSSDSVGILATSAALISKTKQKIMARSQIRTLGDWLKLELEIENIQPLQKYIPYAFNTDLTTIPKGRRRRIKGKVRSVLEKEGKISSIIQQEAEASGKSSTKLAISVASETCSTKSEPNSEPKSEEIEVPKSVHRGPPINPNYSPEVPNIQIQSELELVKKAIFTLKDSRASAMVKSSNPSHHFDVSRTNISVTLNTERRAPEFDRSVRAVEPGSEAELELITALQTVENEMVTMLQRTYFYGYPHRRVPKNLLLESELYSYKSPDEDVFLILMMPLSIKPYNKLLAIKKEIEALLKRIHGAKNSAELQEELKNLHQQREGVIRAFTGYLNKKRINKLQDLVNKYTLSYEHLKGQPRSSVESALKFIRTTQIDLRQHLILAKQYLAMEERKQTLEAMKSICP